MGPGDLSKALAPLLRRSDPRVLVGHETFDDAGVFRLSDDLALVQTVDFFAPIVDDPYTFGAIAAANALSDVYAMGGTPLTALSIAGFPTGKLPVDVLTQILLGSQETVHAAGAVIIGGHTIIDDEVKYGLAVTGQVNPRRMLTNTAAVVGDSLVLTKPIGTGILATAVKQGRLSQNDFAPAVAAMRTLNAQAASAAQACDVRCATDVTGFGLLGHASHIARGSAVTLRISASAVPVFPLVRKMVQAGVRTGGAERNLAYLAPLVNWGSASEEDRAILIDPQTSGGLLLAIPAARLNDYLASVPGAVVIGEAVPKGDQDLVLDP